MPASDKQGNVEVYRIPRPNDPKTSHRLFWALCIGAILFLIGMAILWAVLPTIFVALFAALFWTAFAAGFLGRWGALAAGGVGVFLVYSAYAHTVVGGTYCAGLSEAPYRYFVDKSGYDEPDIINPEMDLIRFKKRPQFTRFGIPEPKPVKETPEGWRFISLKIDRVRDVGKRGFSGKWVPVSDGQTILDWPGDAPKPAAGMTVYTPKRQEFMSATPYEEGRDGVLSVYKLPVYVRLGDYRYAYFGVLTGDVRISPDAQLTHAAFDNRKRWFIPDSFFGVHIDGLTKERIPRSAYLSAESGSFKRLEHARHLQGWLYALDKQIEATKQRCLPSAWPLWMHKL